MVILRSMKNMLVKVFSDIGSTFYHFFIKAIVFLLFILVIGFVATSCAKAMTINDNLRTIPQSQLDYLKEIGERSSYKNYVIYSDYVYAGSYNNYYSNYYICLTNNELDVPYANIIETNCNKIYRYTTYNGNSFVEIVDSYLKLNNTFYYTNVNKDKDFKMYFIVIIFLLNVILFYIVLRGML